MNFTAPKYAILFLNSENYIMHVINHEWNRFIFVASAMCFVWDTKPYFPSSLPSWISFNSCMLILVVVWTILLLRCIKWTPRLVVSLADNLALMASSLLPSMILLWSPLIVEMMIVMILLALHMMMRWPSLSDSPFVTRDKKWGVVLVLRE